MAKSSQSAKSPAYRTLTSQDFLSAAKKAKETNLDPVLSLKNENIAQRIIVRGVDELRCERLVTWIEQTLFPASSGCETVKISCHDLSTASKLDQFIIQLGTLSLFAKARLCILTRPEALRSAPAKKLAEALHKLPPTTAIVFIQVDSKKALVLDELSSTSTIVELGEFTPQELRTWIERELVRLGHRGGITPDATKLLSDSTGGNLLLLATELARLTLLLDADQLLEREFLLKNSTTEVSRTPFELLNAIAAQNVAAAEVCLRTLFEQGQHPLQVSSMLSRGIRTMLYRAAARDEGSKGDAAEYKNAWFVRNLAQAERSYTVERLQRSLRILSELDRDLKSSGISPELRFSLTLQALAARPPSETR